MRVVVLSDKAPDLDVQVCAADIYIVIIVLAAVFIAIAGSIVELGTCSSENQNRVTPVWTCGGDGSICVEYICLLCLGELAWPFSL